MMSDDDFLMCDKCYDIFENKEKLTKVTINDIPKEVCSYCLYKLREEAHYQWLNNL